MSIPVYIHTTDAVKSKFVDKSTNAVERMDNDCDFNFTVYTGYSELDNTKRPVNTSRNDWLDYVEEELYYQGYMRSDAAHVIVFDGGSTEGAGWSQWNIGADESEGGFNGAKKYRDYTSNYGIANINTASDLTSNYYQNTVIHEVGHLFDLAHNDGEITDQSDGYTASPMCTWYVEDDCYTTDNDPPGKLCYNANDRKHACEHRQELSNCSVVGAENWYANHI